MADWDDRSDTLAVRVPSILALRESAVRERPIDAVATLTFRDGVANGNAQTADADVGSTSGEVCVTPPYVHDVEATAVQYAGTLVNPIRSRSGCRRGNSRIL
jgi:hypothetical protein